MPTGRRSGIVCGLICLALLVCACSGGGGAVAEDSPGAAVQHFFEHLDSKAYDDAYALYSEETRAMFGLGGDDEGFRTWADGETRSGTIARVDVSEAEAAADTPESATVSFKLIYDDGSARDGIVTLVREGDGWKLGVIG